MIIISDTTPIIALMKASQLNLLEILFSKILIPRAVFEELVSNISFKDEAETIRSSPFINIVTVSDHKTVDILRRATGLDLGESEAIVYAEEIAADIFLMDERKGRAIASSMGLPVMGSIGVLREAYAAKIITAKQFRSAIAKMQEVGIRLSERLIRSVLDEI